MRTRAAGPSPCGPRALPAPCGPCWKTASITPATPVKLYYLTSCYRYEKPQAGRLRELHQFGVEMFGAARARWPTPRSSPWPCLPSTGWAWRTWACRSIPSAARSAGTEYHKALKEYFTARKDQLCDTCLSRLERNPMRILDCKSPECQEVCKGAPKITDYLCADCQDHFQKVQGLPGPPWAWTSRWTPAMVRGLDYYTRTVFEFPSNEPGAQCPVCGGGRYDGLVEEMGGKPTAGLGFGLGLDRLHDGAGSPEYRVPPSPVRCEVYLASMGEEAQKKAFLLTDELHHCGVPADCDTVRPRPESPDEVRRQDRRPVHHCAGGKRAGPGQGGPAEKHEDRREERHLPGPEDVV